MKSTPSYRNMLKQRRTQDDLNQRYADHLEFLWEQYNKLIGIGLVTSVATLGFLLQGIIFNKGVRDLLASKEVIASLKQPLDTNWLISAILSAGFAVLLFIISRWCSQILMERQIYGRHSDAIRYFEGTLENETILPTAIKTKFFMRWMDRKLFLKRIGILNEAAKWAGIASILLSWFSCFKFAWPLIKPLGVA